MDRIINYVGSIPLAEDFMNAQRNAVIGIGHALAAAYGQYEVVANGFVPSAGSGLAFNIGRGSLLYPYAVDSSAYGVLTADPSIIIMQAISKADVTINCIADGANYVLAVSGDMSDDTPLVLDFYNAANPAQTFAGPNNSNLALPTRRPVIAALMLYPAASVPTGWIPLFDIQVPVGTSQVDMTMLRIDTSAPFFQTIPELQAAQATETATRLAADAALLNDIRAAVWGAAVYGPNYNGATLNGTIAVPSWATKMVWRGVAPGGGSGAAGPNANGGGAGSGAEAEGTIPVAGGVPVTYQIQPSGGGGGVTTAQGTSGGNLVLGDVTLYGGVGGYGGGHPTLPGTGGDGGQYSIAANSAFVGRLLAGGPGNDGGYNINSGCGIGASSSWGRGGRASTNVATGYNGGVGAGAGGCYKGIGPGGQGGPGALQWYFLP